MRHMVGVVMCATLLLSGCGKKKEKEVEKKSAMTAENSQLNPFSADLDETYVFDDSVAAGDEYAFVDENNAQFSSDESLDLTRNETASSDVSDEDLALFNDDEYSLAMSEDGADLNFEPLRFYFDSDKLAAGQEEAFKRNVELAQKAVENGQKVVLNAYCDHVGVPTYNNLLSDKRAEALKKKYVEAGVPSEFIEAVGRGQANFRVAQSSAKDRLQRIKEESPNRRAELQVVAYGADSASVA